MGRSDENNSKKDKAINSSFELFESLVGAAQVKFSESNSNLLRQGCFTPLEIRAMVRSKELPSEKVLGHLTNCSNCFRDYRFALQVAKQVSIAEPETVPDLGWRNWFSFTKINFAWSFLLVFILGSVVLIVLMSYLTTDLPTTDLAENFNQESRPSSLTEVIQPPIDSSEPEITGSETLNESKTNISSPNSNKSHLPKSQNQKQLPKIERKKTNVILDFAENSTLRESNDANLYSRTETVISSSTSSITAKVDKIYNNKSVKLLLVDSIGNTLFSRVNRVRNQSLEVKNLNLRDLSQEKIRVCLQVADEVPDCRLVTVK